MNASPKTLLVMAGGTGGHIYPGIAVAEILRAQGWRIAWMGNPTGMEARRVPPLGYEMAWVDFTAVRGKGWLRKFLLPMNLLRAFGQAWRHMRRLRPDVVMGMGGYVSFPGGMMAALAGRPLVLHEQNSVAGMANRVLAKVADRVLSGFPNVLKNAQWVGNPVRDDIAALPEPAVRMAGRSGALRVLVVGGSLGAAVLNTILPQVWAKLPAAQRPQVVHQAGEKQFDALCEAYKAAGVQAELLPFIDDMATRYAWADVVICRAGALTIAELAAVGVASILVPFPHAVDDHQTRNARFLADAQAAVLLPQSALTVDALVAQFQAITRENLCQMGQRARLLGKADAARTVAGICEDLAGRPAGKPPANRFQEGDARETQS